MIKSTCELAGFVEEEDEREGNVAGENTGTLFLLRRNIGRYPRLSSGETLSLFRKMSLAKEEDRIAIRTKIYCGNMRLIETVAKSYYGKGACLSDADLAMEAAQALLLAIDKFDVSKGYKFSTYAFKYIRGILLRALAKGSRLIHLPESMIDELRAIEKAESELENEIFGTPSDCAIAKRAGLGVDRVQKVRTECRGVLSYDAPISNEGDCEDSLWDQFADPSLPTPAERLEFYEETEKWNRLHEQLGKVMDELSPRDRNIVQLRFGLGGRRPMKLADIARQFGITRVRAGQIVKAALAFLGRRLAPSAA